MEKNFSYKDKIVSLIEKRKKLEKEISMLNDARSSVICDLNTERSKFNEASRFDINIIGPRIVYIISKIEDKKYSFHTTFFDDALFYLVFPVGEKVINEEDYLELECKYGKENYIHFYSTNLDDKPSLLVNFKKFSYLEDFIDSVIEFRLNKYSCDEVGELTHEELDTLSEEFLNSERVKKLTLN